VTRCWMVPRPARSGRKPRSRRSPTSRRSGRVEVCASTATRSSSPITSPTTTRIGAAVPTPDGFPVMLMIVRPRSSCRPLIPRSASACARPPRRHHLPPTTSRARCRRVAADRPPLASAHNESRSRRRATALRGIQSTVSRYDNYTSSRGDRGAGLDPESST